jgi:hypothetical protein
VAQQPGLEYIGLQFDRGEIGRSDDLPRKDSFRMGKIKL